MRKVLEFIFNNGFLRKCSNDAKVKATQAFVYISAIVTMIFAWDTTLFLTALALGWLCFGLCVSVGLHKYAAHRSYEPKNRLIKWIVLWFATIGSLGSTICWAAGHRAHHRHSDHIEDPHRPKGNLWHKIKVWFYYVPAFNINPLIIKELSRDKDHAFFHRHYYKIIYSYIGALALIDPIYVGYFYGIPIWYTLIGISWATVIAHIPVLSYGLPGTWRTYNSKDYTVNSHLWSLLFIGEGLHNTHHAVPGLWNNAINKGEFDLTAPIIKLIGKPNNATVREHPPIRRGYKKIKEELRGVQEYITKYDKTHSKTGHYTA